MIETEKCRIYGQNSPNFSQKISPKIIFFYTLLAGKSSFSNIDLSITFLLYDLESYFFLNDVDIQLILEFKNSFGKYHPVCRKNPQRVFLGHAVERFIDRYIDRTDPNGKLLCV